MSVKMGASTYCNKPVPFGPPLSHHSPLLHADSKPRDKVTSEGCGTPQRAAVLSVIEKTIARVSLEQ